MRFKSVRVPWIEVFKVFERRGFVLVTPHYVNAHQPLHYYCKKHPQVLQKITFNSLQNGNGCFYCGLIKRGKSRALTLQKVKDLVSSRGYRFMSISSLNSKGYIKYICPKHPTEPQTIRYNNLQQGNGCIYCYLDTPKKFNFRTNTTNLSSYLRGHLGYWEYLSGSKCNFKCLLTGDSKYALHHVVSFKKLLNDAAANVSLDVRKTATEYSQQELVKLSKELIRLHLASELGVCLSHTLHRKYHSLYGTREEVSKETFEEFVSLYKEGRLEEALSNRRSQV